MDNNDPGQQRRVTSSETLAVKRPSPELRHDGNERHEMKRADTTTTVDPGTNDKLVRVGDDLSTPKRSEAGATWRSLFRYPAGAYFCLGNEFAERFSFYGMRAILIIYLISAHHLTDTQAKLVFHAFVFAAYFSPIFGSVLADGFWGRYRVILVVSIFYCVGHGLLTLGAVPGLGVDVLKALDYGGLLVIALATGGIKPCVSAFAADQFPPEMAAERTQFFSFFYFMINLGALMSQVITPVLRRQPCLQQDTCFPLAFGVPAVFMLLATLVFCAGTRFYKITKCRENVIWRVIGCLMFAAKQRLRRGRSPADKSNNSDHHRGRSAHWLDAAYPKYDQALIDDVKSLLEVTLLFVPVVLFWALFEQQGSTWVLQGGQMNGRVGRLTILPDQMGVLNPLLVIVLVPLMEAFVYPLLARCNVLTKPLRRMSWGGVLAALSFLVAGLLQLAVDKTVVRLPDVGQQRIAMVNFLDCPVSVANLSADADGFVLGDVTAPAAIQLAGECPTSLTEGLGRTVLPPSTTDDEAQLVAIYNSGVKGAAISVVPYKLAKTAGGRTRVIVHFLHRSSPANVSVIVRQNQADKGQATYGEFNTTFLDVEPDLIGSNEYEIFLRHCPFISDNCVTTKLADLVAETGAVHALLIDADDSYRMMELIKPNCISILWQVPQYVIITLGELLFSITGLAFSYSQASPKMKSVLQAIWLLTSAFGNLIDIGLSGSGLFEHNQALEFFVYGGLMLTIMTLFVYLAWRYRPKQSMDH